MSTPDLDEDDGFPDLTAGEYVLGVLDAAESAIARRRIATEPAFAAEVAGWENRLIPLIEQVAPVIPPASLWDAIAERLTPHRRVRTQSGPGFWRSLDLWRGLAFASTALAAASIAVVVIRNPAAPVRPPVTAPAPAPLAVAQLTTPQGGAVAFIATYDPNRRQLVVTPTGRPVPMNRSPQLWLMPAGQPPVSLGVLPSTTLVVQAPAGLNAASTLGVSLEPFGGSPSGAPTGPVIAVGQLMRV